MKDIEKNPTEEMLRSYREAMKTPSTDGLRQALGKPAPHRRALWLWLALPAAAVVGIVVWGAKTGRVSSPLAASTASDRAAQVITVATSSGSEEQQIVGSDSSSAENAGFSSTSDLDPSSTVGDDF